jgi:hypothetical protein
MTILLQMKVLHETVFCKVVAGLFQVFVFVCCYYKGSSIISTLYGGHWYVVNLGELASL